MRTRILTAIGVLVALTAGFFTFAPSAFAHHPEITGTSSCQTNGTYLIDWTSTSWSTGAQGTNTNVAVSYKIGNGSYNAVPSGSPGAYNAGNSYHFSGSFSVPGNTTSVTLKAKAVAAWGNGTAGGQETTYVVAFTAGCTPRDGSLTIKKVTTGDTAPAPGTNFTFNVTGPENFQLVAAAGNAAGATKSNLPYGQYTITEVNPPPLGVTYNPGNVVTVGAQNKNVTVTATNAYRNYRGSLKFTKVVTGDLAQQGVTYKINYDGPGGADGFVELQAGETKTVNDLPLGSYAITETNAPSGVVINPNPAVIGQDGQTVEILVTNPYPGGYLQITKNVTGAAAPAPGTQFTVHYDGPGANDGDVVLVAGETKTVGPLPLGTYNLSEPGGPAGSSIVPNSVNLTTNGQKATINVNNPFPGAYLDVTKTVTGQLKPPANTQYTVHYSGPVSGDLTVTADGSITTSPALPVGTYTITEVDAPAGATVSPSQATITANDDNKHVAVKVTNPYPGGFIDVTKTISGDLPPDPTTTFTIHYAGPVSGDLTIKGGETKTSPALPPGTYTVTEVNAPAGATVTPGQVTITDDNQHVSVNVNNPYPGGYLDVSKVETGKLAPDGTYTVNYTGPVNGSVQVTAGQPANVVGPLPLGTYTLSEVNAPAGATVLPGQVTLTTNGQHASVVATNPFPGGYLDITKLETGELAPGGTYTINYDGPGSNDGSVLVTAGETKIVGPLPLGTYVITEAGNHPGHIINGTPAVIGQDNQHATITVTNPYGDPSAELEASCAKGVVVTLTNGAPDGPDVVFSIKVDGVEVQSGISVPANSNKGVTVDIPTGQSVNVSVYAQQAEGSVLVESFDDVALNCPPDLSAFTPECAEGAYAVTLTNDAVVPVDATVTKDGEAVKLVTVPANGGSVTVLVPMDEDEKATLAVLYGDQIIGQQEVTLDCATPVIPTPQTPKVLGATQTRGTLPVTGSNTAPIAWTALLLILAGGLAAGTGMRIRRRSEG